VSAKPPADTIAALATAAGAAGIGVVRVSGPACRDIARALGGREFAPGRICYARFRDVDGEVIDDGLLLAFAAPHSYTGEDVLEIQAHASPPLLAMLLRRVQALGARPARPGEFTERAFLNGKLDLAQAEGLADLIAAGSEAAARAARRSLDGVFSQAVDALAESLTGLRVYVEAALDFPDEEIDFLSSAELGERLSSTRQSLAELLREAERGQRLRDGLHVLILGPPNAGKSSLLNALAGSDRAIVTAVPGTTRDLLRETLRIDGIELTLVDTAGLRNSEDPIEREGMRRARAERSKADLVLAVFEADDAEAQAELCEELCGAGVPVYWLHHKIDRTGGSARRESGDDGEHFHLSALSGEGLDLLRQALIHAAGGDAPSGAFSARARHVEALRQTREHLDEAASQLDMGAGELAAESLRQAQDQLGEITGRISPDELLGRVFSSFCIGK